LEMHFSMHKSMKESYSIDMYCAVCTEL